MESAFGVDHGEISKVLDTAVAAGTGGLIGRKHAKDKYKGQAGALNAVTTGAGYHLGATTGSTIGALATRGSLGGTIAGGLTGAGTGAVVGHKAGRNIARNSGWEKKSSKKKKGKD